MQIKVTTYLKSNCHPVSNKLFNVPSLAKLESILDQVEALCKDTETFCFNFVHQI